MKTILSMLLQETPGIYGKRTMRKKLLSILVLSVLMASTFAGCGCSPSTLTILSITEGNVSVMKAGTGSWIEAREGMSLEVGDSVKTGDDSNAEITFFDGSTIELQAGTEIEIASLDISAGTGSTTITLEQTIGSVIFRVIKIVDPASRYEVETPTGVVAVRGSAVQVDVTEDGTTLVTNLEGDIWASAQGVELQVPEGRQCIIRPSQPPRLTLTLLSPAPGSIAAPITDITFTWTEVTGADLYDWVLSPNVDLSSPIISVTGIVGTGYTMPIGTALAYDTTYYWQVTAYSEGAAIMSSPIGTFTTVSGPP